jgi:UDP-GlcNAc:undecaprenyl-phosphate GlcNAc-1-phosphate transferase
MTKVHYIEAGVDFVFSLAITLLGMPLAVRMGGRLGLTVSPRLFARERERISYLGGAALAIAVFLTFLASKAINFGVGRIPRSVAAALTGALALLVFGLADDRSAPRGLPRLLRLSVEIALAAWLWWQGLRPEITGVTWLDALGVIFFVVASANAFNLLDNMDGVAGATAAAASAGLFGLAVVSGQHSVALLAAALCGACLGFLRHNIVAARVFLGNGGALFLGFIIGAMALKLTARASAPWGYFAAIAVLLVPAMDTSIVILSRLLAKQSPFQGGVDHLSHRLVLLGATTRRAAMLHALGSALGAGGAALAVVLARHEPLIALLAASAAAGLALLGVKVYEPSLDGGSVADHVAVDVIGDEVIVLDDVAGTANAPPHARQKL